MKQSERELDVKECQKSVRSVRRNDVLQARGDAKPARFKRADEHSEDAAREAEGKPTRAAVAGDDVASATAQCRLLRQRGSRRSRQRLGKASTIRRSRRGRARPSGEELVRRWQRGRVLRARR